MQQLREALPLPCPYRYVIFDRDRKFSMAMRTFLKASGIEPSHERSHPWRKDYASYCTSWVLALRPRSRDGVWTASSLTLRGGCRQDAQQAVISVIVGVPAKQPVAIPYLDPLWCDPEHLGHLIHRQHACLA